MSTPRPPARWRRPGSWKVKGESWTRADSARCPNGRVGLVWPFASSACSIPTTVNIGTAVRHWSILGSRGGIQSANLVITCRPMRIAIVCPGDGWGGGFQSRYFTLLRVLNEEYEVALVDLLVDTNGQDPLTDIPHVTVEAGTGGGAITSIRRVAAPRQGTTEVISGCRAIAGVRTRIDRVQQLVRTALNPFLPAPWERKLDVALSRIEPDVVFVWTFGYPAVAGYISTRHRTVFFAEESWEEINRETSWSRGYSAVMSLLRPVRRLSLRKLTRVVVISPTQTSWAASAFPCGVSVIPDSVDLGYWQSRPAVGERRRSRSIFVIGDFSIDFKARDLYDIVQGTARLVPRTEWPRFIVASHYPLHPILSDLSSEIFQPVGAVADPRTYYAECSATLVPAFLVAGSKSTILQAWACSCAVVTTTAAARSVGATSGIELLAGHDVAEVVEGIVALLGSRDLCEKLIRSALEAVNARHSEVALRDAVRGLFAAIAITDDARER